MVALEQFTATFIVIQQLNVPSAQAFENTVCQDLYKKVVFMKILNSGLIKNYFNNNGTVFTLIAFRTLN